MKKILAKHNIRVPKNTNFNFDKAINNPVDYFRELSNQLGEIFVMKPRSHASSFGVFIIKNLAEFKFITNKVSGFSILYEAEEYIEGILFHCDSLLNHGEVKFIEACQTSYPQLEFISGKNILSLALKSGDPLRRNIIDFTKKCLDRKSTRLNSSH